ncbi:MAG TPA: ComEA family DNA-binding protein [Acidimicrobiia bacterium]|nr:ComEA family DNA-binding protein [Acidimicrobiia bacterium]
MNRPQGVAVWMVLVIAVGAGWWWGGRPSTPVPVATTSLPTSETLGSKLTVHVGGWVARPGLVELAAGARVADAIAAAGGVLPGALTEAINLAEPLTDGSQVVVAGPATPPDGAESPAGPAGDGRIHLNRATAAELDDLPGIGPVIAERIVAHRSEHGPFRAVEDLLDVPGIGEAKLADLRDLVVP